MARIWKKVWCELDEIKCGVSLGKKCRVKEKCSVNWRNVVTSRPSYVVSRMMLMNFGMGSSVVG